jgi:hypothetical protein
MKEIFFGMNAVAALAGWFAWTCIMLRMYKDENENTFNVIAYSKEHWDNWLASLACVPVLLWVGFSKLDLGSIDIGATSWSDLYYLSAGFAPELIIKAFKNWKQK